MRRSQPLAEIFAEEEEAPSEDKPEAAAEQLVKAYKEMRAAADDMDCDRLEAIFAELEDYRIPEEEVELFGQLADIIEKLDNQEYSFFGFSKKKCPWTSINADYLINNHERFENLMLYKKSDNLAGILFISEMSIFSSEASMNDYTVGQTQYTVLKVEKRNKVTGTVTPVFTHRNHKE